MSTKILQTSYKVLERKLQMEYDAWVKRAVPSLVPKLHRVIRTAFPRKLDVMGPVQVEFYVVKDFLINIFGLQYLVLEIALRSFNINGSKIIKPGRKKNDLAPRLGT